MLTVQDEGASRLLMDERARAPYSIEELLAAVNRILASGEQAPVSVRTLRFYIGQGVVARPIGSPKFARYGYEHLLMLLGARMLQDRGFKLDAIAAEVQEIRRGRFDRFEEMIAEWLQRRGSRAVPMVRDGKARYETDGVLTTVGKPVTRIALTPNATIEVTLGTDLHAELLATQEALRKILDSSAKAG